MRWPDRLVDLAPPSKLWMIAEGTLTHHKFKPETLGLVSVVLCGLAEVVFFSHLLFSVFHLLSDFVVVCVQSRAIVCRQCLSFTLPNT